MKKFLKKHGLILLSCLMILSFIGYKAYLLIEEMEDIKRTQINVYNDCYQKLELNSSELSQEEREICQRFIANQNVGKVDFYFFLILFLGNISVLSFYFFLLLLLPSFWYSCNSFKNKIPRLELTRMSYPKFMKKLLKNVFSYVWLIPLTILIVFLIAYFYTKNFDYYDIYWIESLMQQPILFLLIFLVHGLLCGWLYLNIGLCVLRKYHNYFICMILSFLTWIGIEAFLEIAINGILCGVILKNSYGIMFNIMNVLSFHLDFGAIFLLILDLLWVLLSSIGVYFCYRNKEKFVLSFEKNS